MAKNAPIGLLDYWTIGLLDYWTIGLFFVIPAVGKDGAEVHAGQSAAPQCLHSAGRAAESALRRMWSRSGWLRRCSKGWDLDDLDALELDQGTEEGERTTFARGPATQAPQRSVDLMREARTTLPGDDADELTSNL